jgi:uroporphyrinogen-III synthase
VPRILITRAPHQASPLADALRAAGLEPVLIPTIEIAPPTTFAALDAALASLDTYHWLIFTSANAVEAFHDRLQSLSILYPLPSTLCLTAIGPATARALGAIGLTPTLIPPTAVAESLAGALLPHARSGTRFLLVRAEQARDVLPDALTAAGAGVTIAPAYRTVIPTASAQQIRTLFHSPATWPDAIAFTSSSTVTNLLALLESAGLTLPSEIRRISIGPITSQTLRELGYPPHAEAAETTVPALAEILIQSTAS